MASSGPRAAPKQYETSRGGTRGPPARGSRHCTSPSILSTALKHQRPIFWPQLNFQSQSLPPRQQVNMPALDTEPPAHSIYSQPMSKSKAACPWGTAWPGTLICGPIHTQAMCSPWSVATQGGAQVPNHCHIVHWHTPEVLQKESHWIQEVTQRPKWTAISRSHGTTWTTKTLWSLVSSPCWELATPEAVRFLDE